MNKRNFITIKLNQGEMHVYDFSGVKLHAYQTGDPLADEVFLLEKAGQFVVLESPCFVDSIAALSGYLEGKTVAGMLVAYHGAGASFLRDIPRYATANAVEYAEKGGGRALIDQFAAAFGSAFDSGIHAVTHVIGEGPVTIGGIEFVVHRTAEAFDVEIPEINAVYTHMLGHDCHSIVAGAGHADGMIAQLNAYTFKIFGKVYIIFLSKASNRNAIKHTIVDKVCACISNCLVNGKLRINTTHRAHIFRISAVLVYGF